MILIAGNYKHTAGTARNDACKYSQRNEICIVTRIPRTRLGLETTFYLQNERRNQCGGFEHTRAGKKSAGTNSSGPRPEKTSPIPSRAVRSCSSITGLISTTARRTLPAVHVAMRIQSDVPIYFLSLRKWEAMPAARCANLKENIRRAGVRRRGRRRGRL
jgi:hypothetical protein